MARLGRRLAFDYGDVRIGVAVCDPDGILATPLDYLESKNPAHKKIILALLSEYEPTKIYVGLPLHLSGQSSEASAKAESFAELLRQLATCPVEMVDERLTTSSASASLSMAGLNSKQAREKIDSQSAVLILESGLARDRE
jgi:putative Holliday junction resolvase